MLIFRSNGSFKIVQFTDIHWKLGLEDDQRSASFMAHVIEWERPDLVVVTGDMIDKKECPDPLEGFASAAAPLCKSGIPWAFVFGNHERESGAAVEQFAALLQSLPHSLYQPGPDNVHGASNYVLKVQSNRSEKQLGAVLYMLDSGAKTNRAFGGTEWLQRSQIDWYCMQSDHLTLSNRGEALPSLAFFHIPFPEYNEVWDYGICYGLQQKAVDSPKINSGMFAAMLEKGDVMGTFTGHSHLNDYAGDMHGIRLVCSRLTGFGAKGPADYMRGARVIVLYEGERRFDTWQRLEDGSLYDQPPIHLPECSDPYGKRTLVKREIADASSDDEKPVI
ncbi:metallophosphoesterase family protein [Paenibacillus sp. UNC451MF]|uniref:metallophosphoesterase family protein n=1 Tax=Paenibacillus sp. UNC451MF TaxID=1449063 RepID=UPI00068BC8AE|nr:metallophosphoesterase family protein [Paenibacillus sp. UNC451MF]